MFNWRKLYNWIQVVIRNSLIGNNVVIQDGCKIGLKGFGFIPLKGKNLRFPHIGKVLIKEMLKLELIVQLTEVL